MKGSGDFCCRNGTGVLERKSPSSCAKNFKDSEWILVTGYSGGTTTEAGHNTGENERRKKSEKPES